MNAKFSVLVICYWSEHIEHQLRCSIKTDVLKNFVNFTGKHLWQNPFLNNVITTLLKKRPWHRCFPVKFAKFLITTILYNTSKRPLLTLSKLSQLLLLSYYYVFLTEIPNRRKIFNKYFNLFGAQISLDETIKSMDSETGNKSPGLTAEFYKHFFKWTSFCLFRYLWLLGKAWHYGCYF